MNFGSRSALRLAPLRAAPPLSRLVTANTLSSVGDGARFAALPLLAAAVTHDVFWVSVVAAAGRAAWLPAPLIGTLVDRMAARRSMVGADLARCALLAVLTAITVVGWVPVTLLVLLAFLCGIAEVFFDSAAQAVVPRLAADQQLERTNARIIGAQITGTGFIGPPLGAALWTVGEPWPFAVDAFTFLASALLLRGLPACAPGERAERGTAGLLRGTWAGLRLLGGDRVLRRLMVVVAVLGVGQQAVYAVLVVYVEGELGLPSWGYGLMLVAAALGSLSGARTAARTVHRLGTARSLVVSVTVSALTYLVVAVMPWWPLVALMLAGNSAAVVLWNVCTVSLRQRLAPPDMLGRVTSGYRLAAWGTMPVGAALGGVLAGRVGPGAPWATAGLLLLACLPLLRAVPSAPSRRADAPGGDAATDETAGG
ncbi:MFS transporter [Streptomyces sp. NBC_00199]|uniref:MFS transporter n=1 Tax=Streptomyces sp. NBC_00199 TaxID=2975678 RepID=UPI002255E88B|nr:MFS transporter [Streptomyces sp. NBC_00199]MCX5265893.1 MFS transporter [Streptomyces sp. NBC_00199]